MLDILDIIIKKRDGRKLDRDEINFFVNGIVEGTIPYYQASALLMAIYFKGLDEEETFILTDAIVDSGESIDLSDIDGIKVDKHSTGGVGDKITPIATSIAAAAGVPVAKMSGRGLGYTGGTVDKMESIPGFRTRMTTKELAEQVRDIGIALITHTEDITPADRKLYALRDVTGTVENRSLVASSIMSKKIASGSDAIVLDVKCGNGAFFKTEEEAGDMVRLMIDIGDRAGKKTVAVISDMNRPLGHAVGNSLEIIEAIDVLKGRGAKDTTELAVMIAAVMILVGGRAGSIEEAVSLSGEILRDGRGLAKFREVIKRQGGDERVIDDYSLLGTAKFRRGIKADRDGFVTEIDTAMLGLASQRSGAGRIKEIDPVDHNAGIIVRKKTGDAVKAGDEIAVVFSGTEEKLETAVEIAEKAYVIGERKPADTRLIKNIIGL